LTTAEEELADDVQIINDMSQRLARDARVIERFLTLWVAYVG